MDGEINHKTLITPVTRTQTPAVADRPGKAIHAARGTIRILVAAPEAMITGEAALAVRRRVAPVADHLAQVQDPQAAVTK